MLSAMCQHCGSFWDCKDLDSGPLGGCASNSRCLLTLEKVKLCIVRRPSL